MKRSVFGAAFIWSCICVTDVFTVQITDLRVPSSVRNGSGPVVLDCEYSLRPEEVSEQSGLVVKWFFNNGPEPVYQWIPGQKPQELGILRGKLKLGHRASDNVATMHRALYIVNPTIELSGEYKCAVSTFKDEDFMIKKMIVFAPEKRMDLRQIKPTMELVNVTCSAQGIYPEPKIAIFRKPKRTRMDGVTVETMSRNGAYDILATKMFDDTLLPLSTVFECELWIPETNYSTRKSVVYFPGMVNPSTESGCQPLRISGLLLLVVELICACFFT